MHDAEPSIDTAVVPAYDLLIVHRVNTDIRGHSVSGAEFGELVRRILDARPGA